MNALACFFICLFILQALDFFLYGGTKETKSLEHIHPRAQYRGIYHDSSVPHPLSTSSTSGSSASSSKNIFDSVESVRMDVAYKTSVLPGLISADMRLMLHGNTNGGSGNTLRTLILSGVLKGAKFETKNPDSSSKEVISSADGKVTTSSATEDSDWRVVPAFGTVDETAVLGADEKDSATSPEKNKSYPYILFSGTVPRIDFLDPPPSFTAWLWHMLFQPMKKSSSDGSGDSGSSSSASSGGFLSRPSSDHGTTPIASNAPPRLNKHDCNFQMKLWPAASFANTPGSETDEKIVKAELFSYDCLAHQPSGPLADTTSKEKGDTAAENLNQVRLKLLLREVDSTRQSNKSWNLSVFLNVLTLIEMTVWAKQITNLQHSEQIYLPTLFFLALHTMVETFMYLVFSARGLPSNTDVFNNFCVVIFLKFLLFASMQMRLILHLWRAERRRRQPENLNVMEEERVLRREIAVLYWRFYSILLITIFLVNSLFADYYHCYLLLAQLFWVPQIYWNVKNGYKNAFHWNFLSRVSCLRVLPILYAYSCPFNAYTGEVLPRLSGDLLYLAAADGGIGGVGPGLSAWFCDKNDMWPRNAHFPLLEKEYYSRGSWNPFLSTCFLLLHVVQLSILYSQRKWSARWFIPWICLPHVYNYHRAPPKDALVGDEEETASGGGEESPDVVPISDGGDEEHQAAVTEARNTNTSALDIDRRPVSASVVGHTTSISGRSSSDTVAIEMDNVLDVPVSRSNSGAPLQLPSRDAKPRSTSESTTQIRAGIGATTSSSSTSRPRAQTEQALAFTNANDHIGENFSPTRTGLDSNKALTREQRQPIISAEERTSGGTRSSGGGATSPSRNAESNKRHELDSTPSPARPRTTSSRVVKKHYDCVICMERLDFRALSGHYGAGGSSSSSSQLTASVAALFPSSSSMVFNTISNATNRIFVRGSSITAERGGSSSYTSGADTTSPSASMSSGAPPGVGAMALQGNSSTSATPPALDRPAGPASSDGANLPAAPQAEDVEPPDETTTTSSGGGKSMVPVCAPCGHWYHYACLEQWMSVKMECPTCRKPLPPLEI